MSLKEKEPHIPMVFFYTGRGRYASGSWHLIPLEQAEGQFGELDFNEDWSGSVQKVWLYGPGKAIPSVSVARVLKDRGFESLGKEVIENLPPGSYITFDEGKIVPGK